MPRFESLHERICFSGGKYHTSTSKHLRISGVRRRASKASLVVLPFFRLLSSCHVTTLALIRDSSFVGAGSEDFVRFVQTYFGNKDAPQEVARPLLEKVWKWVTNHPDIRITQAGQICHHSLSQFEDAEKETANRAAGTVRNAPEVSGPGSHEHFQVSNTMQSLRKSLRDQLSEEHSATIIKPSLQPSAGPEQNAEVDEQEEAAQSWRAKLLSRPNDIEATAFDDSSLEGNAPRLYTSQNRIWQALTGHEIDLKRVPSMEFILLSIIAAHGETGITQPDLFRLSNQDKRSVPKRTDELARKGYIFKNPVQAGKIRTSMCVHSKFVSKSHYLTSADVDDVFQPKQFVPTGFAHLIYDKLKDAGIVPTREIRTRLVSGSVYYQELH